MVFIILHRSKWRGHSIPRLPTGTSHPKNLSKSAEMRVEVPAQGKKKAPAEKPGRVMEKRCFTVA